MDRDSRISVCMATYNGEKYLKAQLDSILLQLSVNDEIIISDDGSLDATLEIIASYKDSRIKVLHNQSRHGVVPNFENAIKYASGDYIFLCDQDDVWHLDKVRICVKALQKIDLVVHNSLIMDENGLISDRDYFSLRHPRNGYWRNLYRNSFMGSCMAFRKELLSYVLPFPKHILWHDMWIGLMAAKKAKILFIPDCLLYYRRHGDNTSATSQKSTFPIWKMICYRWWMLYYTLQR